MKTVEFDGISLNVDWSIEKSSDPDRFPDVPGLYAIIHAYQLGVRIGETGNSLRRRIKREISWLNSMKARTASVEDLRRTLPYGLAAQLTGAPGFRFFVVSGNPRLVDKSFRQDCERFMFDWVRQNPTWVDWNRQKSWH